RLVAVRGPGLDALPDRRHVLSRPARTLPWRYAAQHAGRTRRAARGTGTGRASEARGADGGDGAGRADHPDDPGRLTASGAGFQAAVEDHPGDRAAARRTGCGRTWRTERA